MKKLVVIKKDGTKEDFTFKKIDLAIKKSAKRVPGINLDELDFSKIHYFIEDKLNSMKLTKIEVPEIHNLVESTLRKVGLYEVCESYMSYRNWKVELSKMMDDVYNEFIKIYNTDGDKENANSEETLVTTKRCKVAGKLNGEIYKKFFLYADELEAIKDGFIYIHDRNARLDTYNCCLFDWFKVLKDGFNAGTQSYSETKTVDSACDVLGDVIQMAASQQYGGMSVRIDDGMAYFVEKSYELYMDEYMSDSRTKALLDSGMSKYQIKEMADDFVINRIKTELRQGIQGWEQQFNTVASSRGDFVFVSMVFGLGTKWSERLVSQTLLEVRMAGQGRDKDKKPVAFPKLIFLYDEDIHGEGKVNNDIFELALRCSSKCLYPDYLSLTGDGYVPDIYKKYGKVIFPMG